MLIVRDDERDDVGGSRIIHHEVGSYLLLRVRSGPRHSLRLRSAPFVMVR